MQEEAVKRVKEMQKRSRNVIETPHEPEEKNSDSNAVSNENQNAGTNKQSPPLSSILGTLMGNSRKSGELFNLGNIKIDEEKALIGMLIYILYKQNSDIKLLLALGYLLL